MATYTLEQFDGTTAIIQRDGADILNITPAAVGEDVAEATPAECDALFSAISQALAKLATEATHVTMEQDAAVVAHANEVGGMAV